MIRLPPSLSPSRFPSPVPGLALALVVVGGLAACESGSGTTEPEPAQLGVGQDEVHLGFGRRGELEVRNEGGRPLGPVTIAADPVRRSDGSVVFGGALTTEPAEIASLPGGESTTVELSVVLPAGLTVGGYSSGLRLTSQQGETRVPVDFAVREADAEDVSTLSIAEAPDVVRRGEVAAIRADVRDAGGEPLEGAPLAWSTIPADAIHVEDGRFVALEPGTLRVVATSGEAADTVDVEVTPRGVDGGAITVEATAAAPGRVTSDLWVHGDVAYTGTWLAPSARPEPGNALFVWDVSDPTAPALADSVIVDARVVNDIKVSADGELGVLTHEGSEDRLNGITLLDLSDPLHPAVVTRFTDGLEKGVHNVWIDGDHVYVAVDGVGSGLRIVDVGDPSSPSVVASYYAGSSFLHDVYVRDGLAFLSHWDAGLVILDVGNGIAGGSPAAPAVVSRLATLDGETHNAWYWPEGGYVFVGEEDFDAENPGVLHVVDVSDLSRPREVATYSVPGETPHNFWLDEERAVLYAAWYSRGIRAIDVGGELLGPLERQGREIASAVYGAEGACPPSSTAGTCTWAPQLHGGTLFLSDIVLGLVVTSPPF